MTQSLKVIKNRIRGVGNTKKVTSAMEMISVAKLNRINNMLYGVRPYFVKLESLLHNLLSSAESFSSPFLERRKEKKNIGLCFITSDSGLCGSYNKNIINAVERFIQAPRDGRIKIFCVGRKGLAHFKRHSAVGILNSVTGLNGRYSQEKADEISDRLVKSFLSHEVDEVHIAYTRFGTGMVHRPLVIKFLDIEPAPGQSIDYICEPDKERILSELIPRFMALKFRLVLLEAFSSEHSARTVAMKTATDNAEDLLKELTLLRNKVRQAGITQDIAEIISSSEALKG